MNVDSELTAHTVRKREWIHVLVAVIITYYNYLIIIIIIIVVVAYKQ